MPDPSWRTLDARPSADSLVKPGELVDVVEVTPLTLADRRIYNLLLENAWDAIDKPVTHTIPKSLLRGSHNANDRIGASIERLMSAVVRVQVVWDGEAAIERVQLLGGNVETLRSDGMLEYEIPPRLRRIIANSTVFARLRREVMFALTSKYALTLYEMVQKRGNLRWRSSERFTLDELRAVLGVPKGKLSTWSNLRLRAIEPAMIEVNALSDYVVDIVPVRTGRSIGQVEMRWWKKDGAGQGTITPPGESVDAGRRVPGRGKRPVSSPPSLRPRPAWLDAAGSTLRAETYETARLRHPGYDIYFVESEWRTWSRGKGEAQDPDRAYLAFFRVYAERNRI